MVSEAEHTSGLENSESAIERRETPEDGRAQANLAASADGRDSEVAKLELLWREDEFTDADEVTVEPPARESSAKPEQKQATVEAQPKREGQPQLAQKIVKQTVQVVPAPEKKEVVAAEPPMRAEEQNVPRVQEKPDSTTIVTEVKTEAIVEAPTKLEKGASTAKDGKGADNDEASSEEPAEESEPIEAKSILPSSNGSRPTPEASEGGGGSKEPPEKPPTGGDGDGDDDGGDHNGDAEPEEPNPGESEGPRESESNEGEETAAAATASNEIESRPRRNINELSSADQELLERIQQTHGIPEEGAYGQPVIRLTTNSSDGEIRYSLRENPETHFKSVYVTGHDVAERLRGFGLGRRLLRELGHECILNGVNEIAALTANEAAVRTWLKVFGAQAVEFCDAQATRADHEGWRGKKDVLPMTPEQAIASARERDASLHIRVDISRMTADYPKNKKEYDSILRPFRLEE